MAAPISFFPAVAPATSATSRPLRITVDSIGQFQHLVEIKGDEEDAGAVVPQRAKLAIDSLNRTYVQTASNLRGEQNSGPIGDCTGKDQLLLIAGPKAIQQCRVGCRTERQSAAALPNTLSQAADLEKSGGRELPASLASEDNVVDEGKVEQESGVVTVLGHIAQAGAASFGDARVRDVGAGKQ